MHKKVNSEQRFFLKEIKNRHKLHKIRQIQQILMPLSRIARLDFCESCLKKQKYLKITVQTRENIV